MRKGKIVEDEKIFRLKEKYMNFYRLQIKLKENF